MSARWDHSRIVAGLMIAAALGLWGDAVWAQAPISHCATTSQNLAVRDLLRADYLWYEFLPKLDPARYPSPSAYLDAVRYRPLDRGFSYITSSADNDAFYDESQFTGFGFTLRTDAEELRVLEVFDGSAAQQAGIARGAHITAVNGRGVAERIAGGSLAGELDGAEVDVVVRSGDGAPRQVHLAKRVVTIPSVSSVEMWEVGGGTVGYLNFRNFVTPSYAALDAAFRRFREASVGELILDLRYNGGGLVDVSTYLASLIGGTRTSGQVFVEMRHNARKSNRNETVRFRTLSGALGLSRLVVITSRATASASELLINGLRPFMPVAVVGDTTYGKPVGQYGVPICGNVVAPVTFESVNALGAGGYFDGIAADCAATDDLDRPLGDPAEASLSVALAYLRSGSCGGTAPGAAASPTRATISSPIQVQRLGGWRMLLNAY